MPPVQQSEHERIADLESKVQALMAKGEQDAATIAKLIEGIQALAAAKTAASAPPAAPLPTQEEALKSANELGRAQQSRDGWVAPVPPKPSPILGRGAFGTAA